MDQVVAQALTLFKRRVAARTARDQEPIEPLVAEAA